MESNQHQDPCPRTFPYGPSTFKEKAILYPILVCVSLAMVYAFIIIIGITTFLSFELICKTTNAYQLQQDFYDIDASNSQKALVLSNYLLHIPNQYFSARTSRRVLYYNWRASYESIALQTTQDFIQLNSKSTANQTIPQNNEQYIMVKLLVVLDGWGHNFSNVKTFKDLLKSLRTIKAISYLNLFVEELFWTHPFNNVEDLPSLNLIIQPQPPL